MLEKELCFEKIITYMFEGFNIRTHIKTHRKPIKQCLAVQLMVVQQPVA